MKHLMRPKIGVQFIALLGAGAWLAMAPPVTQAQYRELAQFLEEPTPLLLHSTSQGYLGVDLADVDQEKE